MSTADSEYEHPGDKYLIPPDRLEDIEPLSVIAGELDVSISQLENWASRRDKNDFPQPMVTMGRYHLYDKVQVKNWYTLWRKVNQRMGHSKLNGGNNNG